MFSHLVFNFLVAVVSANMIFTEPAKSICMANVWEDVPGGVSFDSVSVGQFSLETTRDGFGIWGIKNQEVWRSDRSGNWEQIRYYPGSSSFAQLDQVSAINYDVAWGIQSGSSAWKFDHYRWEILPNPNGIPLSQIDGADENTAWGLIINEAGRNTLWRYINQQWEEITSGPDDIIQISAVSKDLLWFVCSTYDVYRYFNGTFTQIMAGSVPARLSQVTGIDYEISVGIQSWANGLVFRRYAGQWINWGINLDQVSGMKVNSFVVERSGNPSGIPLIWGVRGDKVKRNFRYVGC